MDPQTIACVHPPTSPSNSVAVAHPLTSLLLSHLQVAPHYTYIKKNNKNLSASVKKKNVLWNMFQSSKYVPYIVIRCFHNNNLRDLCPLELLSMLICKFVYNRPSFGIE